jgi:bla regulator protein BlaR1
MMPAWMAYAITVSALLSVAAFAAEHVAMAWRARLRRIWALALAASVALPVAMPSASIELPAPLAPGGARAGSVFLRDMTSPALAPSASVAPSARAAQAGGIDTDMVFKLGWQAASFGTFAALAACSAWLAWRRRRWSERDMAGARVLVSEDVGPAVVGFLRPRIVVPAWLVAASAERQALVVAHEQGHIDARDPQLLALVLLVLVAMPWNLPLWWQARRLRLAVEVDCDARVLRDGHSVQRYGAALIDVGARQSALSGMAGMAAPMTASRSSLEHRIRVMASKPGRWTRRAAPAFAALSLCMAAMAARVEPPAPVHRETALPAEVLRSHTGYYQLDEHRVIVVAPSGGQLTAAINMGRTLLLTPETANSFFVKGMSIEARFEQDRMILRQYGVDFPAPRVGPAAVEAADAFVKQRFSGQRAFAGSERILRRNLELVESGQLWLDDFTPEYGRVAQRLVANAKADMGAKGKMVAVRFDGVNRAGWDIYRVQYEHGSFIWYLWLDSSGKVADAVYRKE